MFRIASTLMVCVVFSAAAGAQPHPQIVVCFGDSLTAGTGAPPGSAYPDFLRKDLNKGGYHVTIVNQGIAGDTTKDGLPRVVAVLRAHPSVVVLELGANDGLRGQPVDGIRRNLSTIIESLQRARVRILLAGMALPPNLGPDYVRQFDGMYPALAAKYKLPLVPFLLKNVYGKDALMSPDYIHPNGDGYVHVAENVLPYLESMLTK